MVFLLMGGAYLRSRIKQAGKWDQETIVSFFLCQYCSGEYLREHGISSATFYKWRSKFGGMDASLMARLKELEEENRRLKKMYAEERLKAEIISEAMAKKW